MSPWLPQQLASAIIPSQFPRYDANKEQPRRGLTFFQALGQKRKSKAAKEVEFSQILADASEEYLKRRPRPPPPWHSLSPTPVPAEHASHVKEACIEIDDEPPPREESSVVDALTLDAVERLWFAFKDRAVSSMSAKRGSIAKKAGRASVETVELRDFMVLAEREFSHTLEMVRLLQAIFHSIARREGSSVVRTHAITTALVLICRCEPARKLRLLFSIFDADDDECVSLDEIFDLFVSVRANDLSRQGHESKADVTFGGELSLQEAKRLFELTVPHLSVDTDVVSFDDFYKALETCPVVLPNLLPGLFSLQRFYKEEGNDTCNNLGIIQPTSSVARFSANTEKLIAQDDTTREVRKDFIAVIRRGQEHLELSTRLGRAARIMHHQLNLDRPPSAPDPAKREGPLPPAQNAQPRHSSVKVPVKPSATRQAMQYQRPLTRPTSCASAAGESSRSRGVAGHLGGSSVEQSDAEKASLSEHSDADALALLADIDPCEDEDIGWPPKVVQIAKTHYDVQEAVAEAALPQSERRFMLSSDNSKLLRHTHLDAATERLVRSGRDAARQNVPYSCAMCSMGHTLQPRKPHPSEHRARMNLQKKLQLR